MEQPYIGEYKEFISSFQKGTTTGEDVGICVAKMAQYFTSVNSEYATAMFTFNKKAAEIEGTKDDNGKSITSSKAKTLYEATPEYESYARAKVNVANVEQIINALKSLQKGILNEYSHMGLQ